MRITPQTSAIVLNALNAADKAEQTALQQMTTGRRVNQASDDPAAAAVQVGIASRTAASDQFLRSISSVSSELQTADAALNSTVTLLQRAITLGVQGANGTLSESDRASIASEVQGIQQQLVGTANLSYNGKFLFAGTASTQPPYLPDPNAPGGFAYQGNDAVNQVEVQTGQSVAVNLPGSQLFSATGANLFEALGNLVTALQSGSGIGGAATALRSAYDQFNSARAFYGNTVSHLNSDQTFLESAQVQLAAQSNNAIGVDMNAAATNLVNAQNARNAALAAAAQTSSLSLMDYLSGK